MSATIATLLPNAAPPARPSLPFDPNASAMERCAALTEALPEPLRDILAAGRTQRCSRFTEAGFDGLTERWTPPPAIGEHHARMAQRALDELSSTVLVPASPNHLLARVLALLSHYPSKGMTPEVEQLVALDWADDLGEYPAWVIDSAARAWRRTRKWRPSIAEMRALCEDLCAAERALAKRLAAVVEAGVEVGRADRPQDSRPESRVRAMAAGAVRRMG